MISKLLWASPWNTASAIAQFGVSVVEELERMGVEVDIFRLEVEHALNTQARPAKGRVFNVHTLNLDKASFEYDGIVLNLGNYFAYHGAAQEVLRYCAPLVIFHDSWMGHFMAHWREAAKDEAWRVDTLIKELGDDPTGLVALASVTSGAVVHGPHYRDLVAEACPGPVFSMPLAFEFPPVPPPKLNGDRLVIATIGHCNPNKRIDEVLHAIGQSPRLRHKVTYRIIGPAPDSERDRLAAEAKRWGAPAPEFTGWVPDEQLDAMLADIDVICCLRNPVFEGGSASLILALQSARPTLVSNHASYAEVPDGLVMKCAPGAEAADVLAHLEWVLRAPEQARTMGVRARQFALTNYAPKAYAARLLNAVEAAGRVAPGVRAARQLGGHLGWMGARPDDPAVARAAATLDTLFRAKPGFDRP